MGDDTSELAESDRARRDAESGSREGVARFDLVVEGVTDYAIFLLDRDGRVATWNAGAERIKGYRADEIIGKDFSIFYPRELVASDWPRRELDIALRLGRFEDEGWRVRKDGTPFWASIMIAVVRDRSGAVTGFLKITRDLTERKMYEEDLRQSEERFRLLVAGVKDYAIFMLDPDGNVTSWNEGARSIKGYTADEIIGRHFSIFYPPEALAKRWPEYELESATREGRFEDEGWRVRKDGTQFWANVVITPLYDEERRLRGFAKVTRDLTERRRVASLEEANQRMNDFLAMVSHELRTPLNAILGWVRLLQSQPPADEELVQRGLRTIARNAVAQAQLVEDLLDVSRIVSGRLNMRRDPVDLEATVRAAVDALRLAAESKGIRLQIAVEPPVGPVLGDRERLQQVIWNLVSNAIKFTPPGGRVRVELARVGAQVEIAVVDTGKGINPDFLPHVFEQFRQADAGTTRSHGGLGLGLAIVKHFVEAHGGAVHAESEGEGAGARFVVLLPRAASPPTPAALLPTRAVDAAGSPPSLSGARVLVVDDEPDTRLVLELMLRNSDAEVRSAGSAAEAFGVLESWTPDVIVSDVGMPEEDGYAFIQRVRKLSPERGGGVPALALTAYARVEDRLRALQAGYQMHVAKPIEPAELVAAVRNLLEFGGSVAPARTPTPSE